MTISKVVLGLRVVALLSISLSATAEDCLPAEGTAVTFDGNDWIDFGSVSAVFNHTIEAWVRPNSTNFGVIAGHISGPGTACNFGMNLMVNAGFFQYQVDVNGCGNGSAITSIAPFVIGEWTHLAGTYDGGVMRFFVNGEIAAELTGIGFNPSSYMSAGAVRYFNGLQGYYAGDLDELRIWDVARTQSEIMQAMDKRLIGIEGGLVGLWHFDEASGQEARESLPSCTTGIFGGSLSVGEADDPAWVPGAPLCLVQTDLDGDGVVDGLDNCIFEPNPDQVDADGDGYGNACDGDLNGDLFVNGIDLGQFRLAFFSTPESASWNPDADFNDDLQVNAIDLGILKQLFFAPPGPSAIAQVCE